MKKPETYTCPKCGCFVPKKDTNVSGWDSQSLETQIHCPECGVVVDDNFDFNKKQFEIKPFKFEINWSVPFVFSFAFISAILFFLMQEIYLTLIVTFVIMVLFFVIFTLGKRMKKKP